MKFTINKSWYICPVVIPETNEVHQTVLHGGPGIFDRELVSKENLRVPFPKADHERFFYFYSEFSKEDGSPDFTAIVECLKEVADVVEMTEKEKEVFGGKK